MGPSHCGALCNHTCHPTLKPGLIVGVVQRFKLLKVHYTIEALKV